MLNKLPIHILKGIVHLTPERLERKLKLEEKYFYKNGAWEKACKEYGIFIDLSQLRWVNLGAATQLVLFIESAKKSDIQVYIALPLRRLTNDELKSEKYNSATREKNRIKRERVNSFLKTIQFDRAIKCSHIESSPEVKITENFEFKTKTIDADDFHKAFSEEYQVQSCNVDYTISNYKYILPLTWLNVASGFIDSEEFESKFQEILSIQSKGISNIDFLSLKNVVISELIKNVREHAGSETKHALISIGLLPTKTLVISKDEEEISFSNPIENEYLKWLYENNIENLIEIYIGDSGRGLVSEELKDVYNTAHKTKLTTLDNKADNLKILKWAFSKWSTRKKNEPLRGTKGLYRISRIVNKYNGIFLIRSNELHGGFQKGGYSSSKWIDNSNERYYKFPGTMIQLKLCPFKEIIKFNFSFKKNSNTRSWKTINYSLDKSNIYSFEERLKDEVITEDNVLLIIRSKEEKIDYETEKYFLENSLKSLSHLRHPNGIVVYIADEIGKETLQGIAESTNELILKEIGLSQIQETISPDYENVYDPVIILEKRNNIFWFGGHQNIVNILNELYHTQNKNLKQLESYNSLNEDEKKNILFHFQNDDSLVTISQNEEIEFNFTNIQELFENRIKEKLLSESIPRNNSGKIATPKLKRVDTWHDIKNVLISQEATGFALAMYLKVIEKLRDINFSSKYTYILIDHNQQKKLAHEFAKLSGINRRNIISASDDIDYTIPRRPTLFNENDQVIIVTTFISSSETIRRLVKYVRRDIAVPICIICLANYRTYNINTLHTWGEDTPIISLYQCNKTNREKINAEKNLKYYKTLYEELSKCKEFISPNYENEASIESTKIEQSIELPIELKKHFIATKSLHYNHIGRFNGRHFTFYIDKSKFLKDAEFIWEKYLKVIKDWMDDKKIEELIIVKPILMRESNRILENCVEFLTSKLDVRTTISWDSDNSRKLDGKNIVYIDFGALTGNTINRLLSSIRYADHILLCILFSQFQNSESDFYGIIRNIMMIKESVLQNQASLFESEQKGDATVKIKFIYKLPLSFYNSSTCPICEHERVLDIMKLEDEYMSQFANDRKKQLKIIDRKEIHTYPCDFYAMDDDYQYELSSILIMNMYEIKLLLEKALKFTQYRIKLFEYILNIYENLDDEIKNSDSRLYALLYLLSYEITLLQREPLIFSDFRDLISELSLEIATIGIDELIKNFKTYNNYKVTPLKLAIRYKFSAITVLRSARKFKFCKNISNILNASIYDTKFSNNLLQNIFYHIITLHKNRHNKNIEYFQLIEDSLTNFRQRDNQYDILAPIQKSTFLNIKIHNERLRKSLYLDKTLLEPIYIIKSFRDEVLDAYNISHPRHVIQFENLDFRPLGKKAWLDFSENKRTSEFYKEFNDKTQMLIDDWMGAKSFIETRVKPYIKSLDENIFSSEIFSTFKEKLANHEVIYSNFENLIININFDVLNLLHHYHAFHENYDYIYNLFIKYAKENKSDIDNSELLCILYSFPTDLVESINKIFHASEFKDISISTDSSPVNVFYPRSSLNLYLNHIKKNIKSKLNGGVSLSDVQLKFVIRKSDMHISLELLNDKTDLNKRENERGGLFSFREDLIKFGGDLEHSLLDNNFYSVKLLFINYDSV